MVAAVYTSSLRLGSVGEAEQLVEASSYLQVGCLGWCRLGGAGVGWGRGRRGGARLVAGVGGTCCSQWEGQPVEASSSCRLWEAEQCMSVGG